MTTTATDSWRECFERALDAEPANQAIRRDLADHLDELSDPDAEPVRWLADNGKWPDMLADNPSWYSRLVHREHSVLPKAVYDRLRPLSSSNYIGSYYSRGGRRAAEADFCRAFRAAKEAGWNPDASE